MSRLVSLFLLALALPTFGQDVGAAQPYPNSANFGVPFSEDEVWYRHCKRVEHRSAPDPVGRSASATQCDAGVLYYAKRGQAETSAAEWNTVHACALARGDNAVLMMLYANGFGVQRDPDIAMHYACRLDFAAKAEMEGRIAHLANMRPGSPVFDQCDDITSGYMGTICAGIHEGRADRVREARLERRVRKLPEAARRRFGALRAAADGYARAGESDMQDTGAAGFALEREGRRREQFMQAVLDAAGGKLPRATSAQVKELDRELNRVYRKVMAIPSTQDGWPDRIGQSTISRSEVRDAERRWIGYRDAFLAFGAQLGPNADVHAIHALLIRQRIEALHRVAGYR